MSLYLTSNKLNLNGSPFECQACKGDTFTVRHVHNPYGSDMCENIARCDACGVQRREYVGHFEVRDDASGVGERS